RLHIAARARGGIRRAVPALAARVSAVLRAAPAAIRSPRERGAFPLHGLHALVARASVVLRELRRDRRDHDIARDLRLARLGAYGSRCRRRRAGRLLASEGIVMTNRLANEISPYLLQHAHNPVDWYPWSDEAFAKSREEDKPIFLSIGYSACHWCHVMERESFESDVIAAI